MTRQGVDALIKRANAQLRQGDCYGAQATIGQAWLALGEYSAALARQRVSPATALSLHKALSKALVAAGRRCGAANPDTLVQPTWQRPNASAYGPDSLAPNPFGGTGDTILNSIRTTVTTLGIGAAVVGLGYGVWTLMRPHYK